MNAEIENQLNGISNLVNESEVIFEENLDKEFTKIMQKWVEVTSYDDLSDKIVLCEFDDKVYFIKTGNLNLYCFNHKYDNINNINFDELCFKTKLDILNKFNDIFINYFK